MEKRYFLDQDNSGHWYVIELDKRKAWNDWTNLDEDDEKSWTPPKFAQEVGGSTTLVTFTSPVIE